MLALRTYAAARGLEVAAVYDDSGVSGAERERPALDRLLTDARAGRFRAVAVQKLDRLGRSLHHLLDLLGDLQRLGIAFVSLDDAIDTSTPAGVLFMQIRGAFAEYERKLIVERVRSGLAAARARGVRLGREPLDPEAVARARAMIAAGSTVKNASRTVGIGYSTLRRALRADAT